MKIYRTVNDIAKIKNNNMVKAKASPNSSFYCY